VSFQLLAWAVEQRTGSVSRKAVLLALANRANHDTGRCDPSVRRIADECEISENTVRACLKDLAAAGLIEVVQRKRDDGRSRTNHYSFPMYATLQPLQGDPPTVAGGYPPTVAPEPRSTKNLEGEPEALTVRAYDPLVGRRLKVEGHDKPQDLAWNALEAATMAAGPANGKVMKDALTSIRQVVWDWLPDGSDAATDPERYERALAQTITLVADLLQERAPNVTYGPLGVARNFRRGLALVEETRSSDQIVAQALAQARRAS